MVPGGFSWFFKVPGWFSMVPGRFLWVSRFEVGLSWLQVGFHDSMLVFMVLGWFICKLRAGGC